MTELPDEPGERRVAELGLRLGESHELGDLLAAGAGGRHSKQGRLNIIGASGFAVLGAGLTIAMLFPLVDEIREQNGFAIAVLSGLTLLGLLFLGGGTVGVLQSVTGPHRWWLGLYERGLVVARDRGGSVAVPWTTIDRCHYLTTEIYYNGAHTRDTHVLKVKPARRRRWAFDTSTPGIEQLGPLTVFLHAATLTDSFAHQLVATGRVAVPRLDGAVLTADGVLIRRRLMPWAEIGSVTGHTPDTWDRGNARLLDRDGRPILSIPMRKGLHSRKIAVFNVIEQLAGSAGEGVRTRQSDPAG